MLEENVQQSLVSLSARPLHRVRVVKPGQHIGLKTTLRRRILPLLEKRFDVCHRRVGGAEEVEMASRFPQGLFTRGTCLVCVALLGGGISALVAAAALVEIQLDYVFFAPTRGLPQGI